jgi:hypothetical protein
LSSIFLKTLESRSNSSSYRISLRWEDWRDRRWGKFEFKSVALGHRKRVGYSSVPDLNLL